MSLVPLSPEDMEEKNLPAVERLIAYETVPGMFLVLSEQLIILTASNAYLKARGLSRAGITGQFVFDIFPPDPAIPYELGFAGSLQEVLSTGKPHQLPLIRQELPDQGNKNYNRQRYWDVTHTPFFNEEGEIQYIVQHCFDVTDLVQAKKGLEQREKERWATEKHLGFLLNAMPQQVWTATADGVINYVNQICCFDFGKNAEELKALGWESFVHPEDLPGCLNAWKKALQTQLEYMVEFRLLMWDGQYKWFLGKAIPLMEEGKLRLWMGTNTNIDHQKSNEQKKDEFLSIASHELKTPLTTIKAFNQLMKRTNDIDKLHGFVEKSASNIFRLEKLISDLLDVTKINAGKMSYTIKEFDFGQMLQESVESVQYTSSNHELILTKIENVLYTGDRFRIEQVLNNFLTNAVKYSPRGGKVLINSKVQLDNIIVSVQDFGIGIASNDLQRLFERYYRVDNSALRFEGLGLGLFISSEILKGHQGSFWLESKLGEGSTFYFRLPLSTTSSLQPIIEKHLFYKDESITVSYNKQYRRLDVDWTGFQSFESVQRGGMLLLEMLRENQCNKILNDNRNVLGTWSEASEWAGEVWFPMIEKAGLEYFAWIYSPSVFSQLSAKKSVDIAVGNVVTQFFTDISFAEDWLNNK
ncbi:two-component system, chemotaxis family, CheB/CheR fusion protein [Pedobacter steynii]|uniref:histidine kinase n=2 Tax=Pedobacter steynii TaxID=430522 RepID=A0A1G9J5M2_9SPHI|nr:ATP-binding protein [Pedobacter steynii]NQX38150.1 PAS domain-containing sensor histidine kinase [Pedobacter steynii]SDL32837.1 two-component system, chemotaxis family, CheB/CheR fusion protein [Pedobacter steynii]